MEDKLYNEYAEFERLLDNERIFLEQSVTFRDICRKIGADPSDLEAALAEELGVCGEEILEVYRNNR